MLIIHLMPSFSKRFVKRSKPRANSISITETLNATEGARLIEANTLLDGKAAVQPKKKDEPPKLLMPPIQLSDSLIRIWESRKDERVRETHIIADGQRVPGTATPFMVGNSLLMYPGDTSLGAEMKEIIDCRCYAASVIV